MDKCIENKIIKILKENLSSAKYKEFDCFGITRFFRIKDDGYIYIIYFDVDSYSRKVKATWLVSERNKIFRKERVQFGIGSKLIDKLISDEYLLRKDNRFSEKQKIVKERICKE